MSVMTRTESQLYTPKHVAVYTHKIELCIDCHPAPLLYIRLFKTERGSLSKKEKKEGYLMYFLTSVCSCVK